VEAALGAGAVSREGRRSTSLQILRAPEIIRYGIPPSCMLFAYCMRRADRLYPSGCLTGRQTSSTICGVSDSCAYRLKKNYSVLHNLLPTSVSSHQSSFLQIQWSGFDSRHYQIFWEVVDLERGPLSLVSSIEELLVRKSTGSGLEKWEYGRRDPSRWPHGILYPQKLALTSPRSGGLSIGVVRSRTQATHAHHSR
jgi:hypothetical protein